jgi:hypothetical protein
LPSAKKCAKKKECRKRIAFFFLFFVFFLFSLFRFAEKNGKKSVRKKEKKVCEKRGKREISYYEECFLIYHQH